MSNTITVTGKLSKDGELKYSSNGKAMLRLTVPDQKRIKNQHTNEWENASDTTWITATVWEKVAEELAEQAVKDAPVIITGRLITRNYTTQNGEQRSALEIDKPQVVIGKPQKYAERNTNAGNGGGWSADYGRQQANNRDMRGGTTSDDPWATGGSTDANGQAYGSQEPPW